MGNYIDYPPLLDRYDEVLWGEPMSPSLEEEIARAEQRRQANRRMQQQQQQQQQQEEEGFDQERRWQSSRPRPVRGAVFEDWEQQQQRYSSLPDSRVRMKH